MNTYLFLDDIRIPASAAISVCSDNITQNLYLEQNFVIVRNYTEFVNHIEQFGLPYFISFDNDLGEPDTRTGYDCCKWLVDYCIEDKLALPKWAVHSANPVGVINISTLLKNYEKHSEKSGITFQELAKLNKEILSKQPPVTFEEAKAQALWLKAVSTSKNKKKR